MQPRYIAFYGTVGRITVKRNSVQPESQEMRREQKGKIRMRKRKVKRSMIGISMLAVLGIGLYAPGIGVEPAKAATAPVTIDETNFPDSVFREYVKQFDLDTDGSLSVAELEDIEIINVNECGISDLKGIEYFDHLRILRCRYNNLSSLDISKNTALYELNCTNNNLGSLDVSQNTALIYLECNDNNLSSLDLSKNTALGLSTTITPNYINAPLYKNGNSYYIDLSEFPLDVGRIRYPSAGTYDSATGKLVLPDALEVGDTVEYYYDTTGNDKRLMNVYVTISEIKEITDSTTEEPTTEEPTTEEPTAEEPTTEEPTTEEPSAEEPTTEELTTEEPTTEELTTAAPTTEAPTTTAPETTQAVDGKEPAPRTGDAAPLILVVSMHLVSFAGGLTLYIRRKREL